MSFELVEPPAVEPITLAEAKAYLRVDHAAEDALIGDLIAAARGLIEHALGRALITQRLIERLDCWGERLRPGCFLLARPNVQDVHSIKTYDGNGDPHTFDAAHWSLDAASLPSRILLKGGAVFPAPGPTRNGIEIDFTAGFGDAAEDVPAPIRSAILAILADRYERRDGESDFISAGARGLLHPFMQVRL